MTIYWKAIRRDNGKAIYTDFLSADDLIIKSVRESHASDNRLPSVLVTVEITKDEFCELRKAGL